MVKKQNINSLDIWIWDNVSDGIYVDCTVDYNTPSEKRIKFSFKGDNTLHQWKAVNCSMPNAWREYYDELKHQYRSVIKQSKDLGIELRLSKGFANIAPRGRAPVRSLMMLMWESNAYAFKLHLGDEQFDGIFDPESITENQRKRGCVGVYHWRTENNEHEEVLDWF